MTNLKKKIFITQRSHFGWVKPERVERLKKFAEVEIFPKERYMTEEEMIEAFKDVDIAIVGGDIVTRRVIESTSRLKAIMRLGVGVRENVDWQAATEQGIIVTYTPHAVSDTVADYTMALLLAWVRKIPWAYNSTRKGEWFASKFRGVELPGKTLGIIGLGVIGKKVAQRAQGFEMKILAYDPYVTKEELEELEVTLVDLNTLLEESDFITIHAVLTPETKHLISYNELKLMKKTAVIICTSRGGIIHDYALIEALRKGQIAGAALDVFEKEPLGLDHPFVHMENVIVAPHMAGQTWEGLNRCEERILEDALRILRDEKPVYILNPEVYDQLRK